MRSLSQSWKLSFSRSFTVLTSTSTKAVSSYTGFRSSLMIRVEYRGYPSLENVSVMYGSTVTRGSEQLDAQGTAKCPTG